MLLAAGKERKFDTLAEAVQGASDGDTIEIRGNGPFVTAPVKIGQPLTIRAGSGFRPVIEGVFEHPVREHLGIIVARESLVLEGLELHASFTSSDRTSPSDGLRAFGSLSIANCRLVLKTNWVLRQTASMKKPTLFIQRATCPCAIHSLSAAVRLSPGMAFSTERNRLLKTASSMDSRCFPSPRQHIQFSFHGIQCWRGGGFLQPAPLGETSTI